MVQRYTKILESNDIILPFSTIATFMFYENELVVYCCQKTKITKLYIPSVVAYRSHDDFHHPDMWLKNKAERPKTIDNKFPYPALEVINSDWLESFPGYQSRFGGKPAKHYEFVSFNNVVDVLTLRDFSEIVATTVEVEELEKIAMKGFSNKSI